MTALKHALLLAHMDFLNKYKLEFDGRKSSIYKNKPAFLNATIFWDSKRPITTEVLNSIDLHKGTIQLGLENHYKFVCVGNKTTKL